MFIGLAGGTYEAGAVAASLNDTLRLEPFPSLANPLWCWMASMLPSHTAVGWLTAISATCLLIIALLMAFAVRTALPVRPHPSMEFPNTLLFLSVLASPPLVWLAWRPLPLLFNALPALAALTLFTLYRRDGRASRAYASAALMGLAVAEHPAVIFLGIGLLILLLFAAIHHRQTTFRHLLILSLSFGLPIACVIAGMYFWARQEPSAAWRGASTPLLCLRWVGLEFVTQRSAQPFKNGWLYLLVICWLPVLLSWLLSITHTGHRRRRRFWFAVGLLPGVALLANANIAPQNILGAADFPVLSGLAALVGLYLSLRYLLSRLAKPRVTRMVMGALILLSGVQFWKQRPLTDDPVIAAAQAVAHDLPPGGILLSDGVLDDVLRLVMSDKPTTVIALPSLANAAYREFVSQQRADPEWRLLAPIAPVAALKKLAGACLPQNSPITLLVAQEWITQADCRAVPRPFGYEPLATVDQETIVRRANRLEHFLEVYEAKLCDVAKHQRAGQTEALSVLALCSRLANDLGFLAAGRNNIELAERMYRTAIRLSSPQLVAKINLALLLQKDGRAGEAAALWQDIATAAQEAKATNDAEVFSSRAGLLTLSDLSYLRDAVPEAESEKLGDILAVYARGEFEHTRSLLAPRLGHRATSAVWLMYALCCRTLKDDAELRRVENEMLRRHAEWPLLLTLLGERALEQGLILEARRYLTRALHIAPWHIRIAEANLQLRLYTAGPESARSLVDRLLSLDPENALGHYALGLLHLQRQDLNMAERSFRRVSYGAVMPLSLNNLAWVLALQKRYHEALPYVQQAIALDPVGADLWHTLGVVAEGLGQTGVSHRAFSQAESLRRAAQRPATTATTVIKP